MLSLTAEFQKVTSNTRKENKKNEIERKLIGKILNQLSKTTTYETKENK